MKSRRIKIASKNPFAKWIDEVSTMRVAKRLGVTDRTVRYWRAGHCTPRREQIDLIFIWTEGTIGVAEIFGARR